MYLKSKRTNERKQNVFRLVSYQNIYYIDKDIYIDDTEFPGGFPSDTLKLVLLQKHYEFTKIISCSLSNCDNIKQVD